MTTRTLTPGTPGVPACLHCGSRMKKASVSSGNAGGIALALIVFTIGVILSLTVVGAIIGVPLCVVALFMGGKKKRVWRCVNCKSIAYCG